MSTMASAAPATETFKVSVYFEKREDGGLRAYSKDVPGFVLSYADCDATLSAVVPVLESLLSDMFNGPVRVKPLEDMREQLEDIGMIAPKPRRRTREERCQIPKKREYVTELVPA